jgi:hypothetical protein
MQPSEQLRCRSDMSPRIDAVASSPFEASHNEVQLAKRPRSGRVSRQLPEIRQMSKRFVWCDELG